MYWKCPTCSKEGESEDDIVMRICYCCQVAMIKSPRSIKTRVEIKEDGNT